MEGKIWRVWYAERTGQIPITDCMTEMEAKEKAALWNSIRGYFHEAKADGLIREGGDKLRTSAILLKKVSQV